METAAHLGLLKSKYSVPGLNKHLLTRAGLNNMLEEALSRKLAIITAPAGYGKTSAVLKWLDGVSLPYAWFSADSGDNDVFLFWRYFCAALDKLSKGLSEDTEYVFGSPELFKANTHINILIDHMADIGTDFLLVLDDIHLITNRAVFDGLSFLISYLPSNMHLILISRTEPRLKLSKLSLKEDMVRITAENLRFQTEEIAQYYLERGYSLQNEEIQRIERYTGGWAAAMVAIALSLKDEQRRYNAFSSFGSCNTHIENYIAEDVYNTWSKQQQDFMEKTSVLDSMCAPLCEAVTGYDGIRLLKVLYEQNSFLTAMDDEGIWFRYHHLFLDFLRKRLKKKNPASVRNLHRKAGEWLRANGFFSEAIEHFFRGSLYEEALPLIEEYGQTLARRGEYSSVISWAKRLPDKYTEMSPMIIILKASYFTSIEDFNNAWKCIDKLELLLKEGAASSKALYVTYMMAKSNIFLRQGDMENLIPAISEAAACGINTGMNMEYMDLNLYDISMYRSMYPAAFKLLSIGSAEYDLFTKRYRSLINTNPGYAPLIKGEFYYESGKLNEALPELISAVEESANARCPGALVPAMVTIAKIRRAQGDIQGAFEVVTECEHRVGQFHKPHWGYMLKAFKARLHIDAGGAEVLEEWVTESRLNPYQDVEQAREYELIVLARVLIQKQRFEDALFLLNRLLIFAECRKRFHSVLEIANLLAITAMKDLNEEVAMEYLEKSLSIGMQKGYVMSFVDELSPMVSLLEIYAIRHRDGNKHLAYAKGLLSRTKDAVKHSVPHTNPNTVDNHLTATEKKVLKMIVSAYSNKEIADELNITVRTVTAHIGSIYKKLGVKSRTQCIRKITTVNNRTQGPEV
jgi:LuxR family maltose regulon positive regulatory protein